MNSIDLSSIYLLIAFMNLFIPLVTWAIARPEHSRALNLWCAGGVLIAIGTAITATKNTFGYDFYLFILNVFIVLSIVYRVEAIQDFLGKRQNLLVWWGLTLLMSFVCIVDNGYLSYQEITGIFHSLMYARLTYFLFELGKQKNGRSILWLAWAYVFLIPLLVSTLVGMYIGKIPADFLTSNPLTVSLALVGAFISFTSYVGVMGVILDRAREKEMSNVADMARIEANQVLGEQIAGLQRQRIVGQMSATLAHELSQPLSIALSNVQMVERHLHTADMQPAHLEAAKHLQRSIQAIKQIGNLLDRIRSFVRPAKPETLRKTSDLAMVVKEVIQLLVSYAEKNNVSINLEKSSNPIIVSGDPIQLAQIVTNLLTNAIDACAALSTAGPRNVNVKIQKTQDNIQLIVTDNGIGFTPQSLERAGQIFYTTKENGLGLGLSIARTIAEQNGGEITCVNAQAQGAVVVLSLPKSVQKISA